MVAFGHTAVGALVGVAAFNYFGNSNPVAGLLFASSAGVISHYIADTIPHGHFFNKRKQYKKLIGLVIVFDLILPALFLAGLAYETDKSFLQIFYILFGIGGSQLPDILGGLRETGVLPKSTLRAEYNLHAATHWHGLNEKSLLFSPYDFWQILLYILAIIAIWRGF